MATSIIAVVAIITISRTVVATFTTDMAMVITREEDPIMGLVATVATWVVAVTTIRLEVAATSSKRSRSMIRRRRRR
uniref:Uncharacterized protein n=1 Tax=Anopheles darlingi TaxID=43151 RepID=A0A2M4DDU4_ANODA